MDFSIIGLLLTVVALILVSGFFSGSETGMMALNRYRLQHQSRQGDAVALRVSALLSRPDQLLSTILIGNTFANIIASALMTVLSVRLFGNIGVMIATVVLTCVILLFAEVMPKTLAAVYPDRVASYVSWPLKYLMVLLYPFVWLINGVASSVLRVFGLRVDKALMASRMNREELRGLIHGQSLTLPLRDQQMLKGVLNLGRMTVNDVMLPRNQIEALDLSRPWSEVLSYLKECLKTHVLVIQGDLNRPLGVLSMRALAQVLLDGYFNKQQLIDALAPISFIPEGVLVARQLEQFREHAYRVGLVADEYGDVLGLLSLGDILDEVVGEMLQEPSEVRPIIVAVSEGGFRVLGEANIRELNRRMRWNLPDTGPNTLNGLMLESLETLPDSPVSLELSGLYLEVVAWQAHQIDEVYVRVKSDIVGVEGEFKIDS